MSELKRACLTLLTFQAWLETDPPLPERDKLKGYLDDVLFWCAEPLSKRWMRTAGVDQLRDWQSAWRARTHLFPHGLQQDLALLADMLPRLTTMVYEHRECGMRSPRAARAMTMLLVATEHYQRRAFDEAREAGLATSVCTSRDPAVFNDELRVYFARIAQATR